MGRVACVLAAWVGASGLLSSAALAREPVDAKPLPFSQSVPLPQTATIGTRFIHKDFHIHPVRASDLGDVSTRGIPSWTITILDGTDDWDGPTKLPPPHAVLDAPAKVRDRIALFQVESSMQGGWIAVPRGWRVLSAAAGAQGSWGVTFVAPSGVHDGWILVGASGPGTTEVFSGAEGYFPGAYQLENEVIPGAASGDAPLSPRPESLTHPSPCAALVVYESGGLAVKGVRQFSDDGILGFSLALPPGEAALQDFLFATFRKTHPPLKCPKSIKNW